MPSRFALVAAFALSGGCTFAPVVHVDSRAPGADNALVDHLIAESSRKAVAAPTPVAQTPTAPAATSPWWMSRGTVRDTPMHRPGTSTSTKPSTGTRPPRTTTDPRLTDPRRTDPRAGLRDDRLSEEDLLAWALDLALRLEEGRAGTLGLPPASSATTTRPPVAPSTGTSSRSTSATLTWSATPQVEPTKDGTPDWVVEHLVTESDATAPAKDSFADASTRRAEAPSPAGWTAPVDPSLRVRGEAPAFAPIEAPTRIEPAFKRGPSEDFAVEVVAAEPATEPAREPAIEPFAPEPVAEDAAPVAVAPAKDAVAYGPAGRAPALRR